MKRQVIFISGTPCVGKTTVATELANRLTNSHEYNCKLIKINDLAIENDLVLGIDEEKDYKIIDIEKLDILLQKEMNKFFNSPDSKLNKIILVEGHLSHLCSGADKSIVLRLNPDILKERLAKRSYSQSKIQENCEAEALAVCSMESYGIHGDNTMELDCTDLSLNKTIDMVSSIINGEENFPVGSVDFMSWFLD